MRHPTEGTLRRLLDEPAGVADPVREHVAGCPVCLSALAAVQRDAALTRTALDTDVAVDVDAGWARFSREAAGNAAGRQLVPARSRDWRALLRSPVVAVVAALAVLTGATAAAAGDWLPIFRTERIAPVTLSQADLVAMPDLTAYGDVDVTQEPNVRGVADAAAAEKASGLALPAVRKLPRGVSGEPAYQVIDKVGATFTFSVAKAAKAAAAAGKSLPPPPAGLDGSQFRLTAGPGAAAIWSGGSRAPALVVARAVAPTAYSSGVAFPTAVGYLLSLPGLPDTVAAHLRSFTGDPTTLPLPVNSTYLTASAADVDGRPATVLTSRDGVLAGVVWVRDGVVTAVAGSLSANEVLTVARELR